MAKRSVIPKSDWGKIVNEGMGGFLDPPGYPTHNWSVKSVYGDTFSMSLESASESEWLNEEVRNEAKRLLRTWKPARNSSRTIDWMHQVMGYFRGMYRDPSAKIGEEWHVSHLLNLPSIDPVKNQNRHAGVHLIRQFYPDFKLTHKMLEGAYWGTKPQQAKKRVAKRKAKRSRTLSMAISSSRR